MNENNKSIWLLLLFTFAQFSLAADPAEQYRKLIPEDKGLDATWLESLPKRNHPLEHGISGSKKEDSLKYIGMPVGGIACGTLIIDGAGQLYSWDLFKGKSWGVINQQTPVPEGYLGFRNGRIKKVRPLDGANYMNPPTYEAFPPPVEQGFSLRVIDGKERLIGPNDWETVEFEGRWPIGSVHYSDPNSPVEVNLEAYSPFIPLNVEDSKLPVTVMCFRVTNQSADPIEIELEGWLGKEGPAVTKRSLTTKNLTGFELEFADASKKKKRGTLGLAVLEEAQTFAKGNADGLRVTARLAAGESREISYLIAWQFGHDAYAHKFANATAVFEYVVKNYNRLSSDTQAWVNTWNNTTLPQWFMDRSMASASTMQTANLQFAGERFWAWEGIGAGSGTCTHVWGYAQTMARLFPSLERNLREITDFGLYQLPDGGIPFRPSKDKTKVAIDGQCGIVLRSYREHLISANSEFLNRNWASIKKAVTYLIEFDKNDDAYDGLLDGEQHNTLDAEWYGKVHVLCSLYLAALRAGEEMAIEVGDTEFETLCRTTYEMGRDNIQQLYNGEYYIQSEDPKHHEAIGVGPGVYIDQVYGQFWANQVGLGRLYDQEQIRSSLNSIWKYNFLTDVGPFREVFRPGRFYAWKGDGGVLMCTWPKGGMRDDHQKYFQYGYFNEVMSGFEHQLAAHMIAEREPDLLQKGLAIMRTIHDRYAPSKRNPYNEVEFSDFYARAMASYGSFLAACGFDYNGPAGMIQFDPIISPENFRAPFTAAKGWGTYQQTISKDLMKSEIGVSWGSLRIKTIKLNTRNLQVKHVHASLEGKTLSAELANVDGLVSIELGGSVTINKDQTLILELF